MIRREGRWWVLRTHDGRRVLGRHRTKTEAQAQERAVQAAKHAAALGMREFDPAEHPRHPEGAPHSQGGQFRPKGEGDVGPKGEGDVGPKGEVDPTAIQRGPTTAADRVLLAELERRSAPAIEDVDELATRLQGERLYDEFGEPLSDTPTSWDELDLATQRKVEERWHAAGGPMERADVRDEWGDLVWENLSADEKYRMAQQFNLLPTRPATFQLPDTTPLFGTSLDPTPDVERLRRVAARLVEERYYALGGTADDDDLDFHRLSDRVWGTWKQSSSHRESEWMKLAVSEEFGLPFRAQFPERLFGPRAEPGFLERIRVRAPGDDVRRAIRDELGPNGMRDMRALVRANWEVSQWLLERTGQREVPLYRALVVSGDVLDRTPVQEIWQKGGAQLQPRLRGRVHGRGGDALVGEYLPELAMLRNPLASFTARQNVANTWEGVTGAKLGKGGVNANRRVVVRAAVPRTAVMSLPTFGKNYHGEEEVVVMGSPWNGWDAWRDHAPSFADWNPAEHPRDARGRFIETPPYEVEEVPARFTAAALDDLLVSGSQIDRRRLVVVDFDQLDAHWLSEAQARASGDDVVFAERGGLVGTQAQSYFRTAAFFVTDVLVEAALQAAVAVILSGLRGDRTSGQLQVELDRVLGEFLPERDRAGRVVNVPHRIETIARTNVAVAVNEGRWATFGDPDLKGFVRAARYSAILDDRTRERHAAWHGVTLPLDDPRWFGPPDNRPPNGFNSFLPDTRVTGQFVAGSKALYAGPAVELQTRHGRRVAVTPNHPILTGRGFIAAHAIREGDHLVVHGPSAESLVERSGDHRAVAPAAGRWAVDHQEMPPRIEDVFEAFLREATATTPRWTARCSPLDFHGDAAGYQGEVHIVGADGLLPDDGVSVATAAANQRVFVAHGHAAAALHHAQCMEMPTRVVGVGAAADWYAPADQSIPDGGARGVALLSNPEFAHASGVEFDQVVNVQVRPWLGHVYDLESPNGWIVANGIVARNCRCLLVPVTELDDDPITPDEAVPAEPARDPGFA